MAAPARYYKSQGQRREPVRQGRGVPRIVRRPLGPTIRPRSGPRYRLYTGNRIAILLYRGSRYDYTSELRGAGKHRGRFVTAGHYPARERRSVLRLRKEDIFVYRVSATAASSLMTAGPRERARLLRYRRHFVRDAACLDRFYRVIS